MSHPPNPCLVGLKCGSEGRFDFAVEQRLDLGGRWAPGAGGEGAVDLLVFDDVGPVFDDPRLACPLLIGGGFEECVGVLEGELPSLEFVDDVSAVRWCGGEDLVELVEACDEFAL